MNIGWSLAQFKKGQEGNIWLKKMYRILAKILIGLMAIWLIIAVTIEVLGITIYFPFHISPDHEIPYHRWQSVRLSVFVTFAYSNILLQEVVRSRRG